MGGRQVVLEPRSPGTVDPDDGRADPEDEFARLVLAVGRDRVLEIGDRGVGLRGERLRQLRLVRAGGEEQRAETVEFSRASFMSDIRVTVKPLRDRGSLTPARKSDIKASTPSSEWGGRG